MGEATINPKAYVRSTSPQTLADRASSLEDAMLKALPTLFPHLLGTDSSAKVEFYNKFQRQADDYDNDFVKKYDDDLNTTLIFVRAFGFPNASFMRLTQPSWK